ncbi:MAG: hypothetical protein RL490_2306, partial [Pseudomonadota bacterium]
GSTGVATVGATPAGSEAASAALAARASAGVIGARMASSVTVFERSFGREDASPAASRKALATVRNITRVLAAGIADTIEANEKVIQKAITHGLVRVRFPMILPILWKAAIERLG